MQENILTVEHVTKRFGGLVALNDVSLHVNRGEIVGLIGPNGAGKTTMFNAINGSFPITSGRIVYQGKDISSLSPDRRCRLGIGRTFQITKPFGAMTVLENVAVGAIFGQSGRQNLMSKTALEKGLAHAEEILTLMNFAGKKDALAGTLNVPERKRLEICRALATGPDLLLLDEVIAGLNPSEVGGMVELVQHVNGLGISILMIEHVMKAVIATGTPQEIVGNPAVIQAYLGTRGSQEVNVC